ncbi:MAG TPA: CTP synthase, partial [Firmicutes bacterium]|nr:CTP synthase [Bacillota bacterium]
EFCSTCHPVISLMESQQSEEKLGGTMRLGLYPCKISAGSLLHRIYQSEIIYERHRHRYEFNNAYRKQLASKGMVFAGLSPDENLVEVIELTDHPWYVGTQFHPEFKSRPNRPHPLFTDFIAASIKNL